MKTLSSLLLSILLLTAASPASAAEPPRECKNVKVSFTFGGTTTASDVKAWGIRCKRAKKRVIVPCLYGDKPEGWSASRKGDRVTLTKGGRRVRYTTNADGGCVRD
jgi:hypothetical protein